MLQEMIFLQISTAFESGTIGDLLNQWEALGFFNYVLPFLLVFALVFGILTKTNIFKDNKMVNGIIAIAVGLMSLQFGFVPDFFSQILPRFGVGLVIILVIMVVLGLFIDPSSKMVNYFLLGVGIIIVGVVLVDSTAAVGWASGDWWSQNWGGVAIAAVLVLFMFLIINSGGSGEKPRGPPEPYHPNYGNWGK